MKEKIIVRIPRNLEKEIEFFAKKKKMNKSKIIGKLLTDGIKQKRLEYALNEYRKRNVSLGRAAEIAKIPLSDFMSEAAKRKIPINYSVESLRLDFEAALRDK